MALMCKCHFRADRSRWSYVSSNYLDIIYWPVVLVGLNKTNTLHDRHAGRNSGKYSMFAIQPIARRKRDKKLATIRVRTRVRHRQYASSYFIIKTNKTFKKNCFKLFRL